MPEPAFESYEQFVRDVYKEMIPLVAVGPANGGEGELEKCRYLEQKIRELGVKEIQRVDIPDPRVKGGSRPNLLAKFGEKKETLWIVAHMDVVPPGDGSLWSKKPFEATFGGDKVYGRGTEDDGQGILLGLVALKALIESGGEHDFSLGLAFVSDEETGSLYGAKPLSERKFFTIDDWILVPDAGNSDGSLIEVAEKGVLWLKIEVKAKQTHASTPSKGLNACRLGSMLMLEIDRTLHNKYGLRNTLFDPPESTFEPTKRLLNVENVNTVPGSDVFYFDCRVLPDYSLDTVLSDVKEIADRFSLATGAKCLVEAASREDASPPTDPRSPMVKALEHSLKTERNIKAASAGIGGGTVAKYFRKSAVQTAVWMTCDQTAHQPDEYVKISNILADAKTVFSLLKSR
ncbi:MAG: M20 family metallo-hydrolase [Thermoprotei archaeon]